MSTKKKVPTKEDFDALNVLLSHVQESEAAFQQQWNKYVNLIQGERELDGTIMDEEKFLLIEAYSTFVDHITSFESYYLKNGLKWMR